MGAVKRNYWETYAVHPIYHGGWPGRIDGLVEPVRPISTLPKSLFMSLITLERL